MKVLITNTVSLNAGDSAILEGILRILRFIFGEATEFVVYDNQPETASKYYPDLKFRKWLYLNYWETKKSLEIKLPIRRKRLKRLIEKINDIIDKINKLRIYTGAWFSTKGLHSITKLIIPELELQQSLIDYSSADLIISTGGTYLVENYPLEPRIFDYKISLFLNKPLIFFTQSLGPFLLPQNRHSLKEIFEKSSLLLLRDHKSQNHILELGVQNVKTHVTADAAFALADTKVIAKAQNTTTLPQSPRIAISVRDWKYFKTIDPVLGREKYVQALRQLTTHLVKKHNAHITYISTCQGIAEYWTDDSKIALDIANQLPDNVADSVDVNRDFHAPKTLIEMLKTYDMVIATRMHMAILALSVGIPVFPIAYEFKTKELFNRLGQGQWTIDIEEIESKSLINSVDLFINSIAKICQTLFPAVQEEQKRAWQSSTLVKKTFEHWQKGEYLSSEQLERKRKVDNI